MYQLVRTMHVHRRKYTLGLRIEIALSRRIRGRLRRRNEPCAEEERAADRYVGCEDAAANFFRAFAEDRLGAYPPR